MSKSSTRSSSNSSKKQRTDDDGGGAAGGGGSSAAPTLVKALLKEAAFLRNVVEMTSVSQTLRLLMTCKELLAAEKDVFEKHKLPAVCDMRRYPQGKELKLYGAIVRVPNSRWPGTTNSAPCVPRAKQVIP